NDWDAARAFPGHKRAWSGARDDDIHGYADHFVDKARIALVVSVRAAVLDTNGFALNPAELAQPAAECLKVSVGRHGRAQIANARQPLRCDGLRRDATADQGERGARRRQACQGSHATHATAAGAAAASSVSYIFGVLARVRGARTTSTQCRRGCRCTGRA